jgi:hypothetical protein
MKETPAKDALDAFGIDQVCELLAGCKTMTEIADMAGVSKGTFISWVTDDADRSARVKGARALAATYWEEKATQVIEDAPDEFELKRAKELAHHYRWRASKIAPKEYGDRLEVDGKGMLPLVIVRDLTGRKDEPEED